MITNIRDAFNDSFQRDYYENLLKDVEKQFGEPCAFRISETPVFISKELKAKIFNACEDILRQLEHFDYEALRNQFMPKSLQSPHPLDNPHFLGIDFGLCETEDGEIEPQLIEIQAFPSLFFYQNYLGNAYREHYPNLPDQGLHYLFSGLDEAAYIRELRDVIIGDSAPENTVLLELYPRQQRTRIDFWATRQVLGVPVVCYTEVLREGKRLFYEREGKKIPIERIYNRIILDELMRYPDLKSSFNLFDDLDVEWITHPDWFFIISKCIMPLLNHKNIPESYYLSDLPADIDLSKFVLKPLFSFAGTGIDLDPTHESLAQIKNPGNYLLQRKVQYAPLIRTLTDKNAKVELRILYIWNEADKRPKPVINLCRMAKGALINVSKVTDERWIGSSIAMFEE